MEHTEPRDLETLHRDLNDGWKRLKEIAESSLTQTDTPLTETDEWQHFEGQFDDLTSRVEKIADAAKGGFVPVGST